MATPMRPTYCFEIYFVYVFHYDCFPQLATRLKPDHSDFSILSQYCLFIVIHDCSFYIFEGKRKPVTWKSISVSPSNDELLNNLTNKYH